MCGCVYSSRAFRVVSPGEAKSPEGVSSSGFRVPGNRIQSAGCTLRGRLKWSQTTIIITMVISEAPGPRPRRCFEFRFSGFGFRAIESRVRGVLVEGVACGLRRHILARGGPSEPGCPEFRVSQLSGFGLRVIQFRVGVSDNGFE